MALSINTNLGVESRAAIPASSNSGIVSENELNKVAKEILTSAARKTNSAQSRFSGNNNAEVKFFDAGYDINAVKQAAANRTGLNVNLSQQALASINALKAHSAQAQAMNLSRTVDGKIHVNSERPDGSELKEMYATGSKTGLEVFDTASTDKDRKGPGGFYLPFQQNSEEEDGLNMLV